MGSRQYSGQADARTLSTLVYLSPHPMLLPPRTLEVRPKEGSLGFSLKPPCCQWRSDRIQSLLLRKKCFGQRGRLEEGDQMTIL